MDEMLSQGDVEIALRDALGRRGLTSKDIDKLLVRPFFKKNGDEFFSITRKRIGFEWSRVSATSSNYEIRIARSSSRRSLLSATERFALETWVALARRKEIGSQVDQEPAWSICANQTTIEIIRNLGLGIEALTYIHNPSEGPVRKYTVADNGYVLGRTKNERRSKKHIGSSVVDYRNFGMTSGFLSVERVDITTPDLTMIYKDGNKPTIEIVNSDLPETIVSGMIGKRLTDIVSDIFGNSEATIKDVKQNKTKSGFLLRLEDKKMHLEPYPGKNAPEWHDAMLKIRR
jgi:hypothetical protein